MDDVESNVNDHEHVCAPNVFGDSQRGVSDSLDLNALWMATELKRLTYANRLDAPVVSIEEGDLHTAADEELGVELKEPFVEEVEEEGLHVVTLRGNLASVRGWRIDLHGLRLCNESHHGEDLLLEGLLERCTPCV